MVTMAIAVQTQHTQSFMNGENPYIATWILAGTFATICLLIPAPATNRWMSPQVSYDGGWVRTLIKECQMLSMLKWLVEKLLFAVDIIVSYLGSSL